MTNSIVNLIVINSIFQFQFLVCMFFTFILLFHSACDSPFSYLSFWIGWLCKWFSLSFLIQTKFDLMINLNTRHQIMNYFRCFFLPCECLIILLNYRLGQFSILSLDPIIKSNRLWAPHFVMQQFSTLKARLCIGAKHARLFQIHNGSSDKSEFRFNLN